MFSPQAYLDLKLNWSNQHIWSVSFSRSFESIRVTSVNEGTSPLSLDWQFHFFPTDSLESPNISISSTSGVSKARNQGLQVFFGTSFTITCSSHDLYQGGVFRLIFLNSTTSLNNTLPAANSSALFSFFEASYFHQGDYICVHHVQINSQNLQLQSQPLSLTVLGTSFPIVLVSSEATFTPGVWRTFSKRCLLWTTPDKQGGASSSSTVT